MRLSTHESNYLIENNVVHHGGCAIPGSTDSSNGIGLGALHGVVVRNNVIYAMPGQGIVAWSRSTTTPHNQRIKIYNNTIYGATLGAWVSPISMMAPSCEIIWCSTMGARSAEPAEH